MKIINYLKPLKSFISWAMLLVTIIWLLNQCDKNRELKNLNDKLTNTKITYSKKPFTPDKGYDNLEPSESITIYPNKIQHDTIYLESKKDTVYVRTDTQEVVYNTNFLFSYPESEKLIQMKLSKKNLELTTLNSGGIISKKKFNINTNRYRYIYDTNNNLTSDKLGFFNNLHPTIGIRFMPIHLGLDANLGIRYTQNKLEYEIGFKTLYYPKFSSKLLLDAYIGVSFTI